MQLEFDFSKHENELFLQGLYIESDNAFFIGEKVKVDIWHWKDEKHVEEDGEIVDYFSETEFVVRCQSGCYVCHANAITLTREELS